MINLIPITSEYSRPSRPIDILLREKSDSIQPIYNYEGLALSLF
ncbi:hypothetical protein [Algoriphagus aquimarinus]